MPSTATVGRISFLPFCRNQAAARNAMNAGIPLFQAFSPIPVQRSTYCDCIKDGRKIDAGCGGGANVARLLAQAPAGHVTGLDYSEVSVAESRKVNQKAIASGRCEIMQGDVSTLPFAEETFDLVTAFETVYFWPDLGKTFQGIFRVLKTGGTFFICNESNGHDKEAVKFSKIIDGMKLYDAGQLKKLLTQAGFRDVETDEKGIWLCVKAVK